MSQNDIIYHVGCPNVSTQPLPPFDALARDFFGDLAAALRADTKAKKYPDLLTFAFWCRPGNFDRLKAKYHDLHARLGRGLAFHIAPSNVPVNAAYTFAFGLIAGNANIVRLPSQTFPQTEILCSVINDLFRKPKHNVIKSMTAFVRYPHDTEITQKFSSHCHARIIWGGDDTVREIRKMPLPVRAVELAFSDRYSLCILDAPSVNTATEQDIVKLADGFYNDTYLMDQNACSSSQLILWLGQNAKSAQDRFWGHVNQRVVARYDLMPVQAVDKFSQFLDIAIEGASTYTRRFDSRVTVIGVENLSDAENKLRGKFGLFFEKSVDDLSDLSSFITTKTQTLTYFGLSKETLQDYVIKHRLSGIDRIVPVGRALDIEIVWDGSDIIHSLSRIIDTQ
jgi:hypothetical protein